MLWISLRVKTVLPEWIAEVRGEAVSGLTSRLLSVSSSVPRSQMVPMSSLFGLEGAYAQTSLRWAPSTVMLADTAPPSSSFGAPRVLRMRAIAWDWSSPLLGSIADHGMTIAVPPQATCWPGF
jgi:hypothetical protein